MPLLRLGIFGTGRMGRVHLQHLVELHRARRIDFVAMGDPLPATLDAAGAYLSSLDAGDLARGLATASTAEAMATDGRGRTKPRVWRPRWRRVGRSRAS